MATSTPAEKHESVEALNDKATARTTRPCPGCATNVKKYGRSNIMDCSACDTKFCWICLQPLTEADTIDHYKDSKWRGCGGAEYDDVGANMRPPLWRRLRGGYDFYLLSTVEVIGRGLCFVLYPVAFIIAHLIVLVARAFSIECIAREEFAEVVQFTSFCCAALLAIAAITIGTVLGPPGLSIAISLFWTIHGFIVCLPWFAALYASATRKLQSCLAR